MRKRGTAPGTGGPPVRRVRPGRGRDLSAVEREAFEHPELYPFGVDIFDFLDAEQEAVAPFEARLRSCWRYILKRVKVFAKTFKPRESAVIDAGDIVNSISVRLAEKDHLWDPTRGRYSTFVEAVIVSVLSGCHEKARPVSGPSNSFSRLKKYDERIKEGTMTRSMVSTKKSIEAVMGDFESWDDDIKHAIDEEDVDVQVIVEALKTLEDPLEIWVFVRKNALLGQPKLTMREMAEKLGMPPEDVREVHRRAFKKIKGIITEKAEDESV